MWRLKKLKLALISQLLADKPGVANSKRTRVLNQLILINFINFYDLLFISMLLHHMQLILYIQFTEYFALITA